MNVVIIEDEEFAARRLESMINEIDSDIQVVSKLESVAGSVNWFKNNSMPDLIFMDIHLEDNLSFAIFDSISINCPLVFTTATDEKSTLIFKKHDIDFLLKPIAMDELVHIIDKYKYLPEISKGKIDSSFFKSMVNK